MAKTETLGEREMRAEVSRQLLWIATPVLAAMGVVAILCHRPVTALLFTLLLGIDFVDHLLCRMRLGRAPAQWASIAAALTIVVLGTAAFAAMTYCY